MPKWATSWAASVQGPYPAGNPSAQPDQRFAFPSPMTGARDQTFRLIVRPSIWGPLARLRFSNVLGARALTLDGLFLGLRRMGSVLVPGTNRQVAFNGMSVVTIPPGQTVWSDPVTLPDADTSLLGRSLAVSFHVVDESGPMTWHAKALTTSYVTAPGAGSKGETDGVLEFPFTTASWFFLDAIDMMVPDDTRVIVGFGDSITDGTFATMNGHDRWIDVLSQRLHAAGALNVSVVNAGIGGNQVVGPAEYSVAAPVPGGPRALDRLDRDVLSLASVSAVIWLEGINDLGKSGNALPEAVFEGMKEGAARIRARFPDVRIIGGTVTPALGSSSPAHGDTVQDTARRQLNEMILGRGLFDAVADFDRAVTDPATGAMRAEFVPDSTTGGPGDRLHPNRAGYAAMAASIDLTTLLA